MIETSSSTAKLDAALAKAQAEIRTAKHNSENPHYGSSYADLAAVWDACRAALTKNGINVSQWPHEGASPERAYLTTRLAHDGEWIKATASVPVDKKNAQGFVAAFTYLKRAGLAAAVGVASEGEDDDGNTAVGHPKPQASKPNTAPPAAAPKPAAPKPAAAAAASGDDIISDAQLGRLRGIASKCGVTEERGLAILGAYGYAKAAEIKRKDYNKIVAEIEQAGSEQ